MSTMDPLEKTILSQNEKKKSQESLAQFNIALIKHTGQFLYCDELAQLCKTARFAKKAFENEMNQKKMVSISLLPIVFNGDPSKVEAFFNQHEKRLALTNTFFREGFSKLHLNYNTMTTYYEFVCVRSWRGVSALQGAALSLDESLMLKILSLIEENDNLRLDAIIQLEDIMNRIEKAVQKNVNLTTSTAASDTDASASRPTSNSNGQERKENSETNRVYADFAEYGAPVKDLIKAYENFNKLLEQKLWAELRKSWGKVIECQQKLPRYVLQEFCKDQLWSEDPEFLLEPPRGDLCQTIGMKFSVGDLDPTGLCGVYKVTEEEPRGARLSLQIFTHGALGAKVVPADLDSAAMTNLYNLRRKNLENTIKRLKAIPTTLALVSKGDQGTGMKP